ncbi:related to trypsin precursor [Rhynchosporium graminicola]|uniref:Related to trypsin n=1 Tax=Rhynchosporium graminicola TaxID=2792576 RepID=A0A1E1LDG3_9HELO|nr:related to trypsin precursor [Rhynchosporium commune]
MMFISVLFLGLAFTPFNLAAPSPSKIDARVAGGSLSKPGEFPFFVATQRNGLYQCGGTLLNAHTVLTAAHCSINNPPANLTIRAGSMVQTCPGPKRASNSNSQLLAKHTLIPRFSLALWHLSTPIQVSDTIDYATIPAQGYDPPVGLKATTAGWGYTTPDMTVPGPEVLRYVNVPVVSRQECSIYGQITSFEICAGGEEGKGSCPYDSGGPIWNAETKEIIGTVESGGGCGSKGVPIVYTNLGSMSDWVRNNSWSA